ncbi:MAG TPA: glycine zipper 2TM domain-containing protein [Pseudorhodoferax sp.]|nr:glycine zipper 2TM domain-containing protein [Pseudorhodoferax sp.]
MTHRAAVLRSKRRCCLALVLAAQVAGAQETAPAAEQALAQVLSAMPIVQQVAVPQQVCRMEQQAAPVENTGVGALVGTVAGGAAGNAFGGGEGRVLATLLGVVLGAFWGDRAEGRPAAKTLEVRHCTLQGVLQPQVIGYDVRYAYAGRQYRVQWPQDPGPTLAVQVTPAGRLLAPTTSVAPAQPPSSAPQRGGEDASDGGRGW